MSEAGGETAVLYSQQKSKQNFQLLTREQALSNLLAFVEKNILSHTRAYKTKSDSKKDLESLEKKTCRKYCNHMPFSFRDSIMYRHVKNPTSVDMARMMIDLSYKYCIDCRRIMPEPVKDGTTKDISEKYKKSICPCCKRRLAKIELLIRKTKMKEALFKFEGY